MKEKAVTDSGDEVTREESRDGGKEGNGGREPSRCSRRLPGWGGGGVTLLPLCRPDN